MKDPTLEKNLTSAKPVTSALKQKESYRYIPDATLERSLTNAKPVTSVLAQQQV